MLSAQAPLPGGVSPETVVATIDGKDVTAGQVRDILTNTPALAGPYRQNPGQALAEYFIMQHLAAEGEKEKLGDSSPWKEQLEALRVNVLANARVNQEANFYLPKEEQTVEYYNRNQAKYQSVSIQAIHISFRPPMPSGAGQQSVQDAARAAFESAHNGHSEEEARTLANDLVKQIRGGADFSALAQKYSDDAASKAAGGDFGVISASSSYPDDFKKAVFALSPGEVSEPIRQSSAFYVIRAGKKSVQPLDEVRTAINQELRQAHLNEFITALRQRFAPTIAKPEFFVAPGTPPPVLNPLIPGKQ